MYRLGVYPTPFFFEILDSRHVMKLKFMLMKLPNKR